MLSSPCCFLAVVALVPPAILVPQGEQRGSSWTLLEMHSPHVIPQILMLLRVDSYSI